MSEQSMSNAEQLCATILFYFTSGMDARKVLDEEGKSVGIRSPEEKDLQQMMDTTPMSVWTGVMRVSEHLIKQIVETEPRDAMTLGKEVLVSLKKGKEMVDKFVGPGGIRPLSETLGKKRSPK